MSQASGRASQGPANLSEPSSAQTSARFSRMFSNLLECEDPLSFEPIWPTRNGNGVGFARSALLVELFKGEEMFENF